MKPNRRPLRAAEVAEASSLEEFGRNLRDWQHSMRAVTSRPEAQERLREAPVLLQHLFEGGNIADGYLAAYVEWTARQNKLETPGWVHDAARKASVPWWSGAESQALADASPEEFRKRNILTVPEPLLRIRAGRPKSSSETRKTELARERQRRYRVRLRAELDRLRKLERGLQKTNGK